MIYPNTQPSGVVGGGGGYDNKKRLQQLLSRTGALPLFGGSGRSASVEDLPSVGAPSLSFNPFLKMLQGRPGETFNNLPQGVAGGFAGGLPPVVNGNPNAPQPGQQGAPSQGANPFDNGGGGGGGFGHFNPAGGGVLPFNPIGMNFQSPNTPGLTSPGAGGGAGSPVDITNPFYHTLLQLAMYGQDR